MALNLLKKVPAEGTENGLLSLAMNPEDLHRFCHEGQVAIFYRGFCYATYEEGDRLSRNFCLVQLHLSGKVLLKTLSPLFDLSYQQCSNLVVRYKKGGLDALSDERKGFSNREKVTPKIGTWVLELRAQGKSYQEIAQMIRFRFRKKIKPQSLCSWVYRQKKKTCWVKKQPIMPKTFCR